MSSNGQLSATHLDVIDGEGTRLAKPAAAVWRRMLADSAAEKVTLRPTPTTGTTRPKGFAGYRDLEAQKWLLKNPTGPVLGSPAGEQPHGTGYYLDVDQGLAWIVKNATRYGITRPLLSRGEPWHLRFTRTLTQLGLAPEPIQGDITMKDWSLYVHERGNDRAWYLVGDGVQTSVADAMTTIDGAKDNPAAASNTAAVRLREFLRGDTDTLGDWEHGLIAFHLHAVQSTRKGAGNTPTSDSHRIVLEGVVTPA
jgi:hypothetical protein